MSYMLCIILNMSNGITNFEQVNQLYGTTFVSNNLTDFEMDLFNGKYGSNVNYLIESVEDADKLDSMCKYFEATKNNGAYILVSNKLVQLNDPRGYFKLAMAELKTYGMHTQKSYEYFKLSSSMGYSRATLNIGMYYSNIGNVVSAIEMFMQSYQQGCQKEASLQLAILYAKTGNVKNVYEWLLKGIYLNSNECLEFFIQLFFKTPSEFYLWAQSLDNTPTIVLNRINTVKSQVDMNFIEDNINKPYKFQFQ
jgi:tetratricopeptide (TPR) repeat protein